MTTEPHTPEKCRACETETLCRPADGLWGVRCTVCFDEKFPGTTTTEAHGTEAERLEKKRRQHAVACVNACAGIDPAAVPELVAFVRKFVAYGHDEYCESLTEEEGIKACTCFYEEANAALAKSRPEPKGDDDV